MKVGCWFGRLGHLNLKTSWLDTEWVITGRIEDVIEGQITHSRLLTGGGLSKVVAWAGVRTGVHCSRFQN